MADNFLSNPQAVPIMDALEQSRGLPRGLLQAMVMAESGGNPNAASSVGATGLTQFMPDTAKQYDVNVHDPVDSLRGTADYMQDLIHKFGGNVQAAVSYYNGGAHNAQQYVDGTAPTPDQVSPANQQQNQNYVQKVMQKVQPTDNSGLVSQIRSGVVDMVKNGSSDQDVINSLNKNDITRDLVSQGLTQGLTNGEIVQKLGGQAVKPFFDARAQVAQNSGLTNAIEGGKMALVDLGGGLLQDWHRITRNDAALKQDQADQQNNQQQPDNLALNNSTGADIGKAVVNSVPYLVAGAVAPEGVAANIAANTIAGAASGAAIPTTGNGQFTNNVLSNAAVGVVTSGALSGAGAVAGKLLNGTDNGLAAYETKQAAAKALGVPLTVADVNGVVKGLAGKDAAQQAEQAIVAKTVASKLGVPDYVGPVDHSLINEATPAISARFDNALNGVDINLSPGEASDLRNVLVNRIKSTTPDTRSQLALQYQPDLRTLSSSTPTISARTLQTLRSNVGSDSVNQNIQSDARQVYKSDYARYSDMLKRDLTPQQLGEFNAANDQYRHLLAAKNAVNSTNDSGAVTALKLMQAGKKLQSDGLTTGGAPFQQLSQDISALKGDKANGLASLPGNINGSGLMSNGLGIGAVLAADHLIGSGGIASILASKVGGGALAKSSNPTLVRLLAGAGTGTKMSPTAINASRALKMSTIAALAQANKKQ